MPCLFSHRWRFDFSLHYVYRTCRFCNLAERHPRYRGAIDTEWEPVTKRANIQAEPVRVVRKSSPLLARVARSLVLMRARMNEGAKILVR